MNTKTFIIILCCLVIGLQAEAQPEKPGQVVRGQVIDKHTLEPIAYAAVTVIAGNKQLYAITDSSGNFLISHVPVGRCEVRARIIGYSNFLAGNILVYSGKETVMEIALEEKVQEIGEVVVTNKLNKETALNRMAVASTRLLSTEEANRYAGSWGDPARMVSNLAGVVAANDSRNDIVIRGNSPMGLLWRLDGFEIANPNHFGSMGGSGGNVGMINNNQLTNSDFYTGAFPAEFGNVTAGIFDLRLRNGNNRKHEYLLSMGFNGFEAGAEGPFSKKSGASYLVNARYSFLDILHKLGMELSGTKGAIPAYRDLCVKVNLPLRKGNLSFVNLLGASNIHMKDDMTDEEVWITGDKGQDVTMSNQQLFSGVNYTIRLSTQTRLENRISLQTFNTRQDVDAVAFQYKDRENYYNCDLTESKAAFTSTLFHRVNAQNYINAGVGVDYLLTDLYDETFYQQTAIVLHKGFNTSSLLKAYAQWQHRFTDDLSIIPGIYGHCYTYSNDYAVEPRLGFRWQAAPALSVHAASGMYSQIQPRQVYLYQDNGNYVNKNLEMTHSWQSVSGVDWKIAHSFRLKAEVYYQLLYNVPVLPSIPEESILNFGDDYRNNWDYTFVNEGSGRNYGLELTLEKFFDNHYYFLVTASLYNSTYKGYDKIERDTKFNGNYAFNALAGYEWKLNDRNFLSFNMKTSCLGGKRYVPATVSGTAVMNREFDYSQAYTHKLPGYFKIDLNLNMKTNFKQAAIEWFFEVTNVTNHQNIWMQYYSANQQKNRYIYQQGFMPMGGIRIYL